MKTIKTAFSKQKISTAVLQEEVHGHPIRCSAVMIWRVNIWNWKNPEHRLKNWNSLPWEAYEKQFMEGDTKNGSLMAGQIAGMIKEERTCADIISSTVSEAGKLMNGVSKNE